MLPKAHTTKQKEEKRMLTELYEIYFPSKGIYTVEGVICFQDQTIAVLTGISLVEAREKIDKENAPELKSWSRIYNISLVQINEVIKGGDIVISNGKIIKKANKECIECLMLMK